MINLNLLELLVRGIPEMLLFMWGIYLVSKEPFNKWKYLFSSMLTAILIFIVRILPIQFGIHTIIDSVLIISISVIIGIPILKAIYSTLFMSLLLTLSEFLNVLMLNILNIKINFENISYIEKSFLGTPSLIFFVLLVLLVNFIIKKRGTVNVSN